MIFPGPIISTIRKVKKGSVRQTPWGKAISGSLLFLLPKWRGSALVSGGKKLEKKMVEATVSAYEDRVILFE